MKKSFVATTLVGLLIGVGTDQANASGYTFTDLGYAYTDLTMLVKWWGSPG